MEVTMAKLIWFLKLKSCNKKVFLILYICWNNVRKTLKRISQKSFFNI